MRAARTDHLLAFATAVFFVLLTQAGAGPNDPRSVVEGIPPWMHVGDPIHRSSVEGYQFSYHLLGLKADMEKWKALGGVSAGGQGVAGMKSHHLMLFLMDPAGRMVTDTEVGFTVRGPDGSEQEPKVTLMAGGFGVDVDLRAKGTYEIKTKILLENREIIDRFKYEVK
jgi:hypothetical protein